MILEDEKGNIFIFLYLIRVLMCSADGSPGICEGFRNVGSS